MGEQKHTALLPCPFCGGVASMEQTESNRWSVGCDAADEPACMGYQSFTTFARRGEATKAWNTRAVNTYPAVADLVEALELARKRIEYLGNFGHERHQKSNETEFFPLIDTALNRFHSLKAGKGGVG